MMKSKDLVKRMGSVANKGVETKSGELTLRLKNIYEHYKY